MANLVRSKTREEELSILVRQQHPDIALISETELGLHDTVVISGYTPFYASMAPSGKCRLLALVKNELKSKTKVLASSHTDIWLSINLPTPLIVVGVYRQWSDTESKDLEAFHNWCATFLDGTKTIISGDFNLDFRRRSDPSYMRQKMTDEHLCTMEALGLQYMGPYTSTFQSHGRFRSTLGQYYQRTSIIDHVYVLGDNNVNVSVLPLGATDHNPVKTVISVPTGSHSHGWTSRRPLAKLSSSALCLTLQQLFDTLPMDIYNCQNVDIVHDTIVATINNALDKVAPYKMVPADKPDRPALFLAQDTLQTMRLRDAAASRNSPDYKVHRNKVCRLIRRDRLRSSLSLINQSKSNPRKLWSLARSFMGANTHTNLPSTLILENGNEHHDENDQADILNTFFIEKIERIRTSIPASHCTTSTLKRTHVHQGSGGTFSFKYPSAAKVEAIIMSLKNTGAVGLDGVPVSVLKMGAPILAGPIAHLVRLSLGSARVPTGFKSAIVRPIYKGKGKSTTAPSSFRPIAILPAMSKVLERCVFETLMEFLEPRLPEGQYGFRQARSTTAAIADAHGQWSSIRASGKILGVMGFDLTSAFDTLDSTLLCNKLLDLGIRGQANEWFKDYLHDRQQCVSVGSAMSPFKPVKHGVPQGSLLGPVLFLAMVADMPGRTGLESHPSRGYVSYADDLCAWSCGDSVETVRADLSVIANNVAEFSSANYLSLSAEKTQVLWSGLPQMSKEPEVSVGETLVKPSPCIELLGVVFDRNLSSNPFIRLQHRASAPILATVRRLSRYLPQAHLAQVASALLVGKLSYAASATFMPRLTVDEPANSAIQKLQVCMNEAARTILGVTKLDKIHTETLLCKAGLPSINRLVVKGIATECWRAINMGTPLGRLILGGQKSFRATRMASSNRLAPPFKFPRDSMAWHAVRIWNLHEELRSAKSLYCAKKVAANIAAKSPL